MNKKTNRSTQRAPTAKPAASIAPSATLGLDGDVPLSASNGVSAPAPLAAHDVLQAALASDRDAPAADGVAAEPTVAAPAPDQVTDGAGKTGKKPAKTASKDVVAPVAAPVDTPVKAARAVKDKFVKVAFSLPESEAGLLDALKKTHQGNGVAIKKSQLLRAGLLALADLDSEHMAKLLAHLPTAPVAGKKKK